MGTFAPRKFADLTDVPAGNGVWVRENGVLLWKDPATLGGGGGAPSGPAGGVLGGTYPDPGFAVDMATQAELDAHAAAADPHTGYQKESEKAAASGYAGLDAGAKVPIAQLPDGLNRQPAYVSGKYYVCCETLVGGGLAGSGSPTVARATYTPFFVYATTTFDRIAVYLTANGAAGALMRLGILNDNAGVPGTVLLDASTVAMDAGAPAVKAITILQQLVPGRYWAVSVTQSATSQVRRVLPLSPMEWLNVDWSGNAYYLDGVTGAFGNNPVIDSAALNPALVALRAA